MKKEYDLRKLKRRPGETKVDAEAAKVPVSIRIEGVVLAALRSEARRLGIPYQTLMGSILHRYVHHELVDRQSAEILQALRRAS